MHFGLLLFYLWGYNLLLTRHIRQLQGMPIYWAFRKSAHFYRDILHFFHRLRPVINRQLWSVIFIINWPADFPLADSRRSQRKPVLILLLFDGFELEGDRNRDITLNKQNSYLFLSLSRRDTLQGHHPFTAWAWQRAENRQDPCPSR